MSSSAHRIHRRSIRYPFIRLIVTAVILGVGLALVVDAVVAFNRVRRDVQRTLSAAATATATAASAAVVFGDARAARDVLRMFDAYPEIQAAGLYPRDSLRLAGYGDERLLPADERMARSPSSEVALLTNSAILQTPIVVDDSVVGTVYVQARLDAYWRRYLTSIAITILVGLTAGALALLLALRFLDRIILPVRQLAEAANDARVGQDFRPRPIPAADDEIGDMVRNFNALLAEINTTRNSLQVYQDGLERLVVERTAELSAAKEAAEEANLTKSRFLAAASHDLRQPIQAMGLFQDALSKTPLNGDQRRISDYLAQSARNLSEILNALLDVSKLDGGMVKPHPEVVSAAALFGDIEGEFAPLALAKGLRFKLFFPDHDLLLYTDAKLLHGLLRNLIDNALKYTNRGGVLVGIRRRSGRAAIQVWDTGIGISPEHAEAIFDEYFQVGNPERDRTKGLGLGLAIAKRLAGILGGRLNCRSRVGQGSLFEVEVPVADDPGQGEAERFGVPGMGGVSPSRFAGSRVVVVEDDPMAAKAIELSLAAYGMSVASFGSAEEALADPQTGSADFYVADFRLPGATGIQFLDSIQERAGRPIRAILLTGETSDAAIKSPESLPWKVLFKPINLPALMAEIERQGVGSGRS